MLMVLLVQSRIKRVNKNELVYSLRYGNKKNFNNKILTFPQNIVTIQLRKIFFVVLEDYYDNILL